MPFYSNVIGAMLTVEHCHIPKPLPKSDTPNCYPSHDLKGKWVTRDKVSQSEGLWFQFECQWFSQKSTWTSITCPNPNWFLLAAVVWLQNTQHIIAGPELWFHFYFPAWLSRCLGVYYWPIYAFLIHDLGRLTVEVIGDAGEKELASKLNGHIL